MSPRGTRQVNTHKVISRPTSVSPDDIKAKLLLRDAQAALDTRDAPARWLGDPPPHQSALGTASVRIAFFIRVSIFLARNR